MFVRIVDSHTVESACIFVSVVDRLKIHVFQTEYLQGVYY